MRTRKEETEVLLGDGGQVDAVTARALLARLKEHPPRVRMSDPDRYFRVVARVRRQKRLANGEE